MFQSTAIRDLNFSIQRLEKARTDYRAALLWMKNVSEKLQNPDYYNQLAKFREVCYTVRTYMKCMCVVYHTCMYESDYYVFVMSLFEFVYHAHILFLPGSCGIYLLCI